MIFKFFRKKEDKVIAEDLYQVYRYIKDEKNWCKIAMARDKYGNGLNDPWHKDVVSFCLFGACIKSNMSDKTWNYLNEMLHKRDYTSIPTFNDCNTHKTIINLLKYLIIILGYGEFLKKGGVVK